jgi:hypothetical protein
MAYYRQANASNSHVEKVHKIDRLFATIKSINTQLFPSDSIFSHIFYIEINLIGY